ncbi:MAG: alkaline phosphatase family protein [Candidatus Sulfotelmatobacter sp.]
MKSGFFLCLMSLLAGSILLLNGCAGVGTPSSQSQTTYQLTVTAPKAGTGTITSSPAGISCPTTCSASFTQGTMVTLTATPGTNYYFAGWGGSCSGTTCSFPINAATSVSATFNPGVGLTVALAGAGTGTVTSTPAGINCSAATPSTCTASFAPKAQVTLNETPATGDTFAAWSGAGCSGTATCSLTLTTGTTVTATFNSAYAALTVSLAGTGTGTVTSTPAGIDCSNGSATGCSFGFAPNTQITLTETPGPNSTFTSWTGCTGSTSCAFPFTTAETITATFGPSNIYGSLNHIIFFAQENRSFDHYFGYMRQYWANQTPPIPDQSFDGLPQFNPTSGIAPLYGAPPTVPGCQLSSDADSCTPDPTNPIQSFSFHSLILPSGKVGTVCEENQSPFWNEAHNDWDYTNPADQPAEVGPTGAPDPPLNGFVFTAAYDARSNGFMDVNGVRGMGYFEDSDLNFYYSLATDFGTSDRWFSPVMDRTQINRAYMYAATSQGYAYPPGGGTNDSKPFTAKTIFEALQDAGISWKIYVDPTNTYYKNSSGVTEDCSTEAAGEAQDMCLAGSSYMNQFVYEAQIQNAATGLWQHFAPISQFAIDLQDDATFPQFAYIEPASSAGLDEHPSDADGSPVNVQLGAQYVQTYIVKPFLQSPTWQDSALIFTYDEAGGLYDHVSPQPATPPGDDLSPFDLVSGDICDKSGESLGVGTCTFGWTGYRVPLIVISPYSRQNFVSHTVRDTTAVLKMVETRFGLSQLTNRDGSQPDMTEFFDFVGKPWATAPTPPTQNAGGTGGICDQTPAASWHEPPEVRAEVTGSGSVSSSPTSAIDKCTVDCTGVFSTGTVVTLTATPDTGSTFTGWGGACSGTTTCTVTPTTLSTVKATFTP